MIDTHPTEVTTPPYTTKCEFYNNTCAKQPGGCDPVTYCEPQGDTRKHQCFVVWTIEPNGTTTVTLKGCFLHEECIGQPRCVEKAYAPRNNVLFCCCDGDMCNENYTWEPEPTELPPPSTPDRRCYGIT